MRVRKSPARSLTLMVVGLAVGAVAVSACSGESKTAVSVSSPSVLATPSAEPTVESAAPTASAITAPSDLTGDAALVWEALMGPTGEYAASASYAAVIDEFGDVEPYVHIREGEERHIAALTRQLERMGVDVPPNPYLGELAAPADLATAARAWADGEVANVEMYDALLAQTDDASLTRVFTNLRRASQEGHLPLFEAAAANGGTLTEEQLAEFEGGMHESGGMGGGGHGDGGGHGMGGGRNQA